MVKLTTAYVEKKCMEIQSSKSLTKELKKDHLKKITHLYMNDKFIKSIGNFAACKNLRVVYLQNNLIEKIENLHFATGITHLYLQHNKISKIENLDSMMNLNSIFLGYNNIGVFEGFENLESLKEINLEMQNISNGESIYFDPRSCKTLSKTLKHLNLSGNRIKSLNDISDFNYLEILEAKNNSIEDVKEFTKLLKTLKRVKIISLQGNPIVKSYRYRENIIANTDSLEYLDGKEVNHICRNFMKKFQNERQLQQKFNKRSKMTLSDDITSSLNLPPAFKRSVTRAIFQHSGPKLSISVTSAYSGESQMQIFPYWKSASSIKGLTLKDSGNRILPIRETLLKSSSPSSSTTTTTKKLMPSLITLSKNQQDIEKSVELPPIN